MQWLENGTFKHSISDVNSRFCKAFEFDTEDVVTKDQRPTSDSVYVIRGKQEKYEQYEKNGQKVSNDANAKFVIATVMELKTALSLNELLLL